MLTIYAEEINYWQTSRTPADEWILKACRLIESFGGEILTEAFGKQGANSAYIIHFRILDQDYKIVWPVLESKTKNEKAARIQAATLIYHDVKAKCLTARVLGVRAAFFQYLMLENGQPAYVLHAPELVQHFPKLLTGRTE